MASGRLIKIEAPSVGDRARWRGPFPGEVHPEKSALFLYLNTGKRSVTLDLEDEGGREILRRLLARADVLVEDLEPGTLEGLGGSPFSRLKNNSFSGRLLSWSFRPTTSASLSCARTHRR